MDENEEDEQRWLVEEMDGVLQVAVNRGNDGSWNKREEEQ